MNTKTFLIIAIVGVLVLAVVSSFFGPSNTTDVQTPRTTREGKTDGSDDSETYRKTGEVSNFIPITDEFGYEVLYIEDFNEYLISITESPFSEYRSIAEQGFLDSLSMSEEEACGLNVNITTPLFVNPDEAGIEYGLSFCEQLPTFEDFSL